MADFTEIYKQSGSLVAFSPNGEFLATAVQKRLVIRETSSMQILQLYTSIDTIQDLSFSANSELVLVASYKLGCFQIFNVFDEVWTAMIDEGALGCDLVIWAPDSRHLLSFSSFQVRLTIWSLINGEATHIEFPKYTDKGYCFRNDGLYFALGSRQDSKEFVSIYDTRDWSLAKRFGVESKDMNGLAWSPDGRFIVIWEPLMEYKVFIYHPDGRLAATYSAYEDALGIKTVSWSPSSQLLAIGSFDEKCRIINHLTWNSLIELEHPPMIDQKNVKIYNEVDMSDLNNTGPKSWSNDRPKLQYQVLNSPFKVPTNKVNPELPSPKIGISFAEFNCVGDLLLTTNESQPQVIWLWDVGSLKLMVVIKQTLMVRKVQWNPVLPDQFAFCCGNGMIYIYDNKLGCDAIEVPAVEFKVLDFNWNPDGKSLSLIDKDKFCLSFIVDE